MSEDQPVGNAHPEWTIADATEEIQDQAAEILGGILTDDTVLRVLNLHQNLIDIALSISTQMGLPDEVQAQIVVQVTALGGMTVDELLKVCAQGKVWQADG